MQQRWFTPFSARRALGRVRPVTELLCGLYRDLEATPPGRVDSDQPVDRSYFERVQRLHAALGRLLRMGVRVRDIRRGLIDFPARRGGREVVLCWRVGEPSLAWWRDPGSSAAGRRPVDDGGPWDDPEEPGRDAG